MRIGRVLSPVHSLGPGERVCIWTQGCMKNCDGCISPELQEIKGPEMNELILAQMIGTVAEKNRCNGLTISGGDPLEQSDSLLEFLKNVRSFFPDILVYTGYELGEIIDGKAGQAAKDCLNYIDVLIDGRYIKALNVPDCVLRGSTNQTIHFFNEALRPVYEGYMKKGRIVECFTHNDERIITGILREE